MNKREIILIIFTIIILSASVSYTKSFNNYIIVFLTIIFVVLSNIISKKLIARKFEAQLELHPWSVYRYGFKKKSHFKEPVPMIWLPIVLTLLTKGAFWWLSVLIFKVSPRTSRVTKKHGLYRFTEMTERDIGYIALSGVITNILLGIIMYIINFEFFAQISLLYALWSLVPISNLDGSKIFFSNPTLWTIISIITGILAMMFTITI